MKQSLSKRSTMAEIAAKAGVSIPTVSRVLHHRPDVAPETRKRVEQLLEEHGLIQGRAKKLLRKEHSGIVDMLFPGFDSMYSFEIARGVEEVIARTDLRLAISSTHHSTELEQRWMSKIQKSPSDGAILVLAHGEPRHFDPLHRHNIPFVVVDHGGELGPDTPSVGATNWLGGRTATEYLISLGHRRVAVITGPTTLPCSQDRVAGYRSALETAGLQINPAFICLGDFSPDSGYEQTNALLDLPEPPTAIFAGCDEQATGVYSALRARGLNIPDDMSVIGFDDVPTASIITPNLTTIRQPLREMGRVATTMLLHLINGEPLDSMRVELTTHLVVRDSCRPLDDAKR
ncbi:LacI family DNA-binding transcriptional regulator [Dictyobacter formicarum]|uniref:LacI family transcriptional regulator n=1 Tax=Dictyobacter formicarum TaxID=2778368 RepID=A0ABQ3VG05_9CHLR|nr:LacI family DNA-binding transcriptional regulator [Dictyobacter formicarum]GHO85094.1 LacI family transcriptional regulator [Dictyobacter formicarum]